MPPAASLSSGGGWWDRRSAFCRRSPNAQPQPLHYTGLVTTIAELEDELSRPGEPDVELLRHLEGDILILGAAGKMGPSLARLCRRTADAAGPARRILAVSRQLNSQPGVEAISCDLLDRAQVAQLPACPNVLYLAGRKFGSSDSPELTWAMNTVAPANVAERFRESRIVVFSTGNVYALRAVAAGGSRAAHTRCQWRTPRCGY